jgi:chromosome segregation ATPase
MAKGKIVQNLGKGKYVVELVMDEELIDARRKQYRAQLEKLEESVSGINEEIESLNASIEQYQEASRNIDSSDPEAFSVIAELGKKQIAAAGKINSLTRRGRHTAIEIKTIEISLDVLEKEKFKNRNIEAISVESDNKINTGRVVPLIESAKESNEDTVYYIERIDAEYQYTQEAYGLNTAAIALNPY